MSHELRHIIIYSGTYCTCACMTVVSQHTQSRQCLKTTCLDAYGLEPATTRFLQAAQLSCYNDSMCSALQKLLSQHVRADVQNAWEATPLHVARDPLIVQVQLYTCTCTCTCNIHVPTCIIYYTELLALQCCTNEVQPVEVPYNITVVTHVCKNYIHACIYSIFSPSTKLSHKSRPCWYPVITYRNLTGNSPEPSPVWRVRGSTCYCSGTQ